MALSLRFWCPWLALVALAGIGAGCGAPAISPWDQPRSMVNDPQTLVVTTEPNFPPFAYINSQGDLVGFDIDLMNAIAQHLDLQVRYAYIPFDGLLATLEAETADAAINSITITPEREENVDFSRPYFVSGLALTVQANRRDIRTLADMAGQDIAVQFGTTGADLASQIPNAHLITFASAEKALLDLAQGNVDAVLKDATITQGIIEQVGLTDDLRLLSPLLTRELYGIALPPGSGNRPFIDQAITDLIADGTYRELYIKWFQQPPPPVPEAVE